MRFPFLISIGICSAFLLFSGACSRMPSNTTVAEQTQQGSAPDRERELIEEVQSHPSAERKMSTLAATDMAVQSGISYQRVRQIPQYMPYATASTENYQPLTDNPVKRVVDQPLSTFSIDVDTGSYANVRRFIRAGQLPPANAVRVEEMLNYFTYDYPLPEDSRQPFSVITEVGPTPWNSETHLLHIGVQGYREQLHESHAANLVFLVDVSGSMNSPKKLGLLKSSLKLLVSQLNEQDSISIVSYAGATRVVLKPTPASQRKRILAALENLHAGGSTNGAAGIDLAYQQADSAFKRGGVNRVILATDGDFNVGISDIEQLKKIIAKKRKIGIELTTLGFGTGNYNDYLMEQLADIGNGNYAYIDTLTEAKKVLLDELSSTLLTIARDVKIQIEFNPAVVSEYRLIGYSNRLLADQDFNNDRVDAGDIGAGHSVTAIYEIALLGERGQALDALRYRHHDLEAVNTDELAFIKLRYKLPQEKHSRLLSRVIGSGQSKNSLSETSDNYRFAAAVACFAQKLSDSRYIESADYGSILTLAREAQGSDKFAYRSGFIELVSLAEILDR